MNNIGGVTQSLQTLAPSYALLGKPAAGLESPENKDQTLPPVEEASAGEKNRHQPNQKADAVSSDTEDGAKKDRRQLPELSETESQPMRELAVIDCEDSRDEIRPLESTSLQVALQRAATLHSDSKPSAAGSNAVDSFSAAAGHTLAPGSLLDQRT